MIEPFSFAIGVMASFTIVKIAKVTQRIYPYLLKPITQPPQTINNQYVIVSGATDGIGLQYVRYLASMNYKILALGRDNKKLQQLSSSFKTVKTMLIDYNKQINLQQYQSFPGRMIFQQHSQPKVEIKLKGIINCAGIAHFSKFKHLTVQEMMKINKVNISAINLNLKTIYHMLEGNKLAKNPFFINVSSAVAQFPQKYSTIYSATKAYQSNLVKSASMEDQNVIFLDVKPWYVKTKMVGYQDTWDCVSPQQVVNGSMRVLGKRLQCNGSIKHELLSQFQFIWRSSLSKRIQSQIQRILKMQQLRKKKTKK